MDEGAERQILGNGQINGRNSGKMDSLGRIIMLGKTSIVRVCTIGKNIRNGADERCNTWISSVECIQKSKEHLVTFKVVSCCYSHNHKYHFFSYNGFENTSIFQWTYTMRLQHGLVIGWYTRFLIRKSETRSSPKDDVVKLRRGNHTLIRNNLLIEGVWISQLYQIKICSV